MEKPTGSRGGGKWALAALVLCPVLGAAPFFLWASTVEPTELDPELSAAAWVFAILVGGTVGLALAGGVLVVLAVNVVLPPAQRGALRIGGLLCLLPLALVGSMYLRVCG